MAWGYVITKKKREKDKAAEPLESADDLTLDYWSAIVEIDEDNNGYVTQTGKGRVNFGRLRDKRFSIFSDNPTSFEDIKLVIRDLNTGEELDPEVLVGGPKYKWIRVPFKYPVEKGEEFGFEASYIQPSTFKALGEDYYRHTSRNNCKDTYLEIRFPEFVKIIDTEGSDIRTSGGITMGIPEGEGPKIVTKDNRQKLVWPMKFTRIGYTYTLMWRTERIAQ